MIQQQDKGTKQIMKLILNHSLTALAKKDNTKVDNAKNRKLRCLFKNISRFSK